MPLLVIGTAAEEIIKQHKPRKSSMNLTVKPFFSMLIINNNEER